VNGYRSQASVLEGDLITGLRETVLSAQPGADVESIRRAFDVAAYCHQGQTRRSGDPYITHPVSVAMILARLGADDQTVCAAILHDTVEDTRIRSPRCGATSAAFIRRRGANAELRHQLAWLGYAGLMTAMWAVVLLIYLPVTNGANGWLGTLTWAFLVLTPVVGIPLACAVAVLKYRLYDIDRIISRTLAYAIVTGLLVGVYAGLVLLATEVLRFRTPVAVAAATLAAAALFNPLRQRVQRAVDRRFNRARYDADQTVAAFAARLKDAVDLDSVRDDLAGVVYQALEPAHVSVWISQRD
jgi:hypothetical protein